MTCAFTAGAHEEETVQRHAAQDVVWATTEWANAGGTGGGVRERHERQRDASHFLGVATRRSVAMPGDPSPRFHL